MRTIDSLIDAETGQVLCPHVELADTYLSRLRGLQFRRQLDDDSGLLIVPCSSVHTACMRFAIDAIWLDDGGRVMEVRTALKPWSVAACRGAKAVLEVPAGRGEAFSVGTQIGLGKPSTRRSVTFLRPAESTG